MTDRQLIPSPQQQAVYNFVEHGSGSAFVEAVAGAGKTTTLIEAVRRMQGSVAFTAYNKAIATEIDAKLKASGAGPSVKAGTFHSFGFLAWRRAAPCVKVEEKKLQLLLARQEEKTPEHLQEFVCKAVSLAKQRALGVLVPLSSVQAWYDIVRHFELDECLSNEHASEEGLDMLVERGILLAQRLLRESIEADREMLDFDDMIYAPLIHDARIYQNDWVLIDEAQDTNPARRALAKKMLRPGGRLIAVGDPRQAIYGFTGADADAVELIVQEFGCTRLPLTITYRCPKRVVDHARLWVSHIEAHASAPEGAVSTIPLSALLEQKKGSPMLTSADTILCRNTKPLVELAYHFLQQGIGCHVEGRDIGRSLMALTRKWRVSKVEALLDKLDEYLGKETARLLAKGQEQQAANLADRIETLKVIGESLPEGATIADLGKAVDALFGDTEAGKPSSTLTLSTVHKAKGREWKRVYLLGRNKHMPSKYARQAWQLLQEDNLCYVAVTRAMQELLEVVVP